MDISFDFDKTLDRPRVQQIARECIESGYTVWIITRRYEDESEEVYKVADELGIPRERTLFTNGEWKWRTIKDLPIDVHWDDKVIEILLIEKYTNTKGHII